MMPQTELPPKTMESAIRKAKTTLDLARSLNDPLRVDLAEAALNDLLERYASSTCHT